MAKLFIKLVTFLILSTVILFLKRLR